MSYSLYSPKRNSFKFYIILMEKISSCCLLIGIKFYPLVVPREERSAEDSEEKGTDDLGGREGNQQK